MAKAPKTVNLGNLAPPLFPLPHAETQPENVFVPAAVTGAWDTLRTALGQTVPANVNAARASSKRLLRTVA